MKHVMAPGSAESVAHLRPGQQLDDAAREWLARRIMTLRSRAGSKGPFQAAGIHRTIAGMKRQLKEGRWMPHRDTVSEGES